MTMMIKTFFPQNIQKKLNRTRKSYEILRFRGPFSGSCWRFFGNMSQQFSSCLVLLKPSQESDLETGSAEGLLSGMQGGSWDLDVGRIPTPCKINGSFTSKPPNFFERNVIFHPSSFLAKLHDFRFKVLYNFRGAGGIFQKMSRH